MNPSYFRIKLPVQEAKERFCNWLGIESLQGLISTNSTNAIDLAVDSNGNWKGSALLISPTSEWTLFQDLTGRFSSIAPEQWKGFARKDSFIFGGYNDAIGYGELVVIEDGETKREFLVAADSPEENKNIGRLDFEVSNPIESWFEVASFVDDDEYSFEEVGELWIDETKR